MLQIEFKHPLILLSTNGYCIVKTESNESINFLSTRCESNSTNYLFKDETNRNSFGIIMKATFNRRTLSSIFSHFLNFFFLILCNNFLIFLLIVVLLLFNIDFCFIMSSFFSFTYNFLLVVSRCIS